MEFAHQRHETAFERVQQYLGELFEDPYHDESTGHFYVQYGSTVLEISVETYGPDDVIVQIMAYCVQGTHADENLLLGLLELNHSLPVGAFSLVGGDDVYFSYALNAVDLDPRRLLAAVAAVANISDEYDDRIVARWGGQRALDRIRSTGGRRQRQENAGPQ